MQKINDAEAEKLEYQISIIQRGKKFDLYHENSEFSPFEPLSYVIG